MLGMLRFCLLLCMPVGHAAAAFLHYTKTPHNDWIRMYMSESDGLAKVGAILQDRNEPPLRSAGEALVRAGNAWTKDWSEVTVHLEEASGHIRELIQNKMEDSASSQSAYQRISDELEDASQIQGCTSVGPPSSVPNFLEIREAFQSLSETKDAGFKKVVLAMDAFLQELE